MVPCASLTLTSRTTAGISTPSKTRLRPLCQISRFGPSRVKRSVPLRPEAPLFHSPTYLPAIALSPAAKAATKIVIETASARMSRLSHRRERGFVNLFTHAGACRFGGLRFYLLGEVAFVAQLLDLMHLRFEPIDVGFLVLEQALKKLARRVVAFVARYLDGFVVHLHRIQLELQDRKSVV